MIENEIDEIILWYDRFTEIVRQLSMSPNEQIKKLKGTFIPDEIATDYSEIGMIYAQKLFNCGWLTNEQFSLVEEIEKQLEKMTQKKELWNVDALFVSLEWNNCRKSGIKLLQTLEKNSKDE